MNLKKSISLVLTLCMVFSLFATFVFPVAAEEGSATISFANTANRTSFSTSEQVWEQNGITVTNTKTATSSDIADYVAPVRFYKNSIVKIDYAGMTKIEIDCAGVADKNVNAWVNSCDDANATATREDSVVTIVFAEAVDSFTITLSDNQARAKAMTVYYAIEEETPSYVASQVVTCWNVDEWANGFGGDFGPEYGAYMFTDADLYAGVDMLWWQHGAFAPTDVAGRYEVVALRAPSDTTPYLTIPEGGFVWTAWSSAADEAASAGAFALAMMGTLKVGDLVDFTGIDVANATNTADATAEKYVEEPVVDPNAPVNIALGKDYTVSQQFRQGADWGWDDNADIVYADDGVKLTDGVTAPASDELADPAWAGFSSSAPDYANVEYPSHKITVDLGSVCDIDSVSMYFASSLVAPGAGIDYKWAWVSIFVSDDNEGWTNVGHCDVSDNVVTDALAGEVVVDFTEAVSARYVQFRVTRSGWTFVSEVEVYGTEAEEEPVVEDNVIDLLQGTTANAGDETQVIVTLGDGVLVVESLTEYWPSTTLTFPVAVTVPVEGTYVEFEAVIEDAHGYWQPTGSIRLNADGGSIWLHQFGENPSLVNSGDSNPATISYKLPLSELGFINDDLLTSTPISTEEVTFNSLSVFAVNGAKVTITKLNLIVAEEETPVEPAPSIDFAWVDEWKEVDENGVWQESKEVPADELFDYDYAIEKEGDNVNIGIKYRGSLSGAADSFGNGKGTNFRIWFFNPSSEKGWDTLMDVSYNGSEWVVECRSNGANPYEYPYGTAETPFTVTVVETADGAEVEVVLPISVLGYDSTYFKVLLSASNKEVSNYCLHCDNDKSAPTTTARWENSGVVIGEVPVEPAYKEGLTIDLGENGMLHGNSAPNIADNEAGLTDGTTTSTGFGTAGGAYLMGNKVATDASQHPAIDFIFNLGAATEVNTVVLDMYAEVGSMVGFPAQDAKVYVSEDGITWTLVESTNDIPVASFSYDDSSVNTPNGNYTATITLNEIANVQYVKVALSFPDSPFADKVVWEWFGLTEIAVSYVETGLNEVEGGALPVFNPFMGTSIPANTAITYTVEFADGVFLALYDPAVTVLVNGEAFEGAADLKYGDKVTIINAAAEDVAVFPRVVPVINGSYNNPIEITASGDYTAVVNDLIIENSNGTVFFVYKSEIFGTLTVTMPSGNWFYNIYNETTGKYGDNHYSDDETVVSSETFLVSPGDVIMVAVATYDPANPWSAPLGELTFNVAISETAKLDDRFGAPEVLFDGYTGVGEITGYEDHMDKLLAFNYLVANGQYTFSVTYEEMVAFDGITLYTLDYANGCVVLPESVVFVVNGVEYEAVITPNANGIATVAVALDAAVVANEITVIVTTDGNAGWFNAFSEFTVNEVAMVSVPDGYGSLDVLFDGYTGVGEITGYEGNQSKLFALMNNFNATSKYTVTVTLAEGTVYDGITFYALDYANGCILMPEAIEVTVDGETYYAYPWTQSEVGGDGFISEIAIDFGKEYSATEITVTITVPYSQYYFSMFTEVALHEIEKSVTGNVIVPDGWGTVDVLIDGYTGVGEITAHDGNHDKLVPFKNADTTVDTPYSFIVPLAESTSFNTVTVYILSHTGGNVGLPKTLSVTINGKTYEAAAVTGDDASVVAIVVDLGETVEADKITVNATIAAGSVKYNAYSEIEVSTVATKAPDMFDIKISHNTNFNWNTYEGNLIAALPNGDNKTCEVAGDVTWFGSGTIEDKSGLYVVENVDGLYVITGYVTGIEAMKATAIPEGGFLYFVCSGNSDWDTVKGGAILGYIFNLNDIDINSKAAIDTSVNDAMVATLVNPDALKVGDVNMNGKIDANDYATIRKLVVGSLKAEDLNAKALELADVNGNGKIDANDYILVKRHVLGTYTIPAWEEVE